MKLREEAASELGHEERVYIERMKKRPPWELRSRCVYLHETSVYAHQAQVVQRQKNVPFFPSRFFGRSNN